MEIVLITGGDRPELTLQTLQSARNNSARKWDHNLIVVLDCDIASVLDTQDHKVVDAIKQTVSEMRGRIVWTGQREQIGVGGAKNHGAALLQAEHGYDERQGNTPHAYDVLVFLDNDLYLLPNWDLRIEQALAVSKRVGQVGGWRHPYHKPGAPFVDVTGQTVGHGVDAATGNCMAMRWTDWLAIGPFDANAAGPGQSEDYALSQRVLAADRWILSLDPPVAIHCGLVNSVGEPATGWRECEDQITRQLAVMTPEMRDEVVIMRPAPFAGVHQVPMTGAGRTMLVEPNGRVEMEIDTRRPVSELVKAHMRQADDALLRALAQPLTERDSVDLLGWDGNQWDSSQYATYRSLMCRPALTGQPLGLNIASGQRSFFSTPDLQWINVDAQSVSPDRVPDVVCDVGRQRLPIDDGAAKFVVIHQGLEHAGCGESAPMLRECWRVLAPGGSLIITVPDMRKLAARWLGGELSTQVWLTNVYGAFMGDEADRHRWGFDELSLRRYLHEVFESPVGTEYSRRPSVELFDWREIPGADIARDWWVLGVEVRKP